MEEAMQALSTTQHTPSSPMASEAVIPAVRGEFYSYRALFSYDRPLGYLMKCKANKDRTLAFGEDNPKGIDLVFVFDNGVSVCSPNSAPAVRLLEDLVDPKVLNQTRIAVAGITVDEFNQLRERKNGSALAEVCRTAVARNDSIVTLMSGIIVAVTTESGKFGLLLVKELTPSTVRVDACHILL